jgi:hypothetical protein
MILRVDEISDRLQINPRSVEIWIQKFHLPVEWRGTERVINVEVLFDWLLTHHRRYLAFKLIDADGASRKSDPRSVTRKEH